MRLKQRLTPFSDKTIEALYATWLGSIDQRENGCIFSAPCMDRAYRIPGFLKLLEARDISHRLVSLGQEQIEDKSDWLRYVKLDIVGQSSLFVYIIADGELLFQTQSGLLESLGAFHITHPRVIFLIFSESLPSILPQVFMQHATYHKLYTISEMDTFVEYLSSKFDIVLSQTKKCQIIHLSGGHPWLVKQMVRFIASKQAGSFCDHDDLWLRVRTIYEKFTESEQFTLQQAVRGLVDDKYTKYKVHLEKVGVLSGGNVAIPLLAQYLDRLAKRQYVFHIKADKLWLNDVVVETFFTKTEKNALKLFLSSPNMVVSRDTLAIAMWGSSKGSMYSDWSLDAAIKRLRIKIIQLGLPGKYIQTVKGKGYYVAS